jgi:hypothetical protein
MGFVKYTILNNKEKHPKIHTCTIIDDISSHNNSSSEILKESALKNTEIKEYYFIKIPKDIKKDSVVPLSFTGLYN